MSDTPRTDSEAIGFARVLTDQGMSDKPGEWMIKIIPSDFARTLERELAAEKAKVARLREALHLLMHEVDESGNGEAKDFGWPKATQAARAALKDTDA